MCIPHRLRVVEVCLCSWDRLHVQLHYGVLMLGTLPEKLMVRLFILVRYNSP